MARLYDRVMAKGLEEFQSASEQERYLWRKGMEEAHIVDGTNVSDYFFGTGGWSEGAWVPSDFPNPRPPLDVMWVETFMLSGDGRRVKIGTLFLVVDDEGGGEIVEAHVVAEVSKADLRRAGKPIDGPRHAIVALCRYPTSDPAAMTVESTIRDVDVPDGSYREGTAAQTARVAIGPAILTVAFMHCKNVERREVEQPPKLSKKWEKKHGRPLVRYHVLDIDPMRKVLRGEGKSEETGLKKALHICRGHFATYTEDAPLFGKVTGTFWKPQHVRGSAKHGAVVKDYNVKAPT